MNDSGAAWQYLVEKKIANTQKGVPMGGSAGGMYHHDDHDDDHHDDHDNDDETDVNNIVQVLLHCIYLLSTTKSLLLVSPSFSFFCEYFVSDVTVQGLICVECLI